MYHDDGVLISIAHDKLFSIEGLYLTSQAREFAEEVAMLIRLMAKENKVAVKSAHPKANSFLKLVAKELVVSDDFFSCVNNGNKESECLSLVIK